MAFIIANYLEINEKRAIEAHYNLYEVDNFTPFIAGAKLLGRDIKEMLQQYKETLHTFAEILEAELALEEESLLVNQMLETNRNLKYEETVEALQCLLNELK